MQTTLQTIPETFRHDIYTHFLIARQGCVAMYAKTQSHGKGVRWEYEVVIVRIQKAGEVFGKMQPEREALPPDTKFGTYGWHYSALPAAWKEFNAQVAARAVSAPLLVHPKMEQFENSITVQMFDSQKRPAGSFQKRVSVPLESVLASLPLPATKSSTVNALNGS